MAPSVNRNAEGIDPLSSLDFWGAVCLQSVRLPCRTDAGGKRLAGPILLLMFCRFFSLGITLLSREEYMKSLINRMVVVAGVVFTLGVPLSWGQVPPTNDTSDSSN